MCSTHKPTLRRCCRNIGGASGSARCQGDIGSSHLAGHPATPNIAPNIPATAQCCCWPTGYALDCGMRTWKAALVYSHVVKRIHSSVYFTAVPHHPWCVSHFLQIGGPAVDVWNMYNISRMRREVCGHTWASYFPVVAVGEYSTMHFIIYQSEKFWWFFLPFLSFFRKNLWTQSCAIRKIIAEVKSLLNTIAAGRCRCGKVCGLWLRGEGWKAVSVGIKQ